MRVLLDECLPRRLARLFGDHAVTTVPEAGWAGKKNGELLALASDSFDVFITIDQFLVKQQDITNSTLAVLVISAPSNRLEHVEPLVPQLLTAIESTQPGQCARIRYAI